MGPGKMGIDRKLGLTSESMDFELQRPSPKRGDGFEERWKKWRFELKPVQRLIITSAAVRSVFVPSSDGGPLLALWHSALKTALVRESSRRQSLQRLCSSFLKRYSQKMSEPACAETPSVPSPSLFSLSGKTALVTGGTRGIGAACAIALAQAGADICLVQRDDTSNTATRDTIRSKYSERKCEIVVADLSNPSATREAFDKALEVMGGEIHILINCAGIQRRSPAVDFSEQDWSDVSATSLFLLFVPGIPSRR